MPRAETREEAQKRRELEQRLPPKVTAPEPPAPDDALPVKPTPVVDFICGLRKVAPNSYVVVTGRIVDGKPEVKVDAVAQPLDHSALSLSMKLRAMIGEIP